MLRRFPVGYENPLQKNKAPGGDSSGSLRKRIGLNLRRSLNTVPLYREGAAAAASALDVRVVELEARTLERLDVVDGNSIQVHRAHLVDQHLEPVKFINIVGALVDLILKGHVV